MHKTKRDNSHLQEYDEFGHIEPLRPHGLQLLERTVGKKLSMGGSIEQIKVRKLLEMCGFNTV